MSPSFIVISLLASLYYVVIFLNVASESYRYKRHLIIDLIPFMGLIRAVFYLPNLISFTIKEMKRLWGDLE